MNNTKSSLSSWIFLLGAASGLVLMLLRAMQVISFSEAQHVVTSGFEEESLYAMWKYLHGLAIYSDPHQIPFSASYFNWLFYGIYGSFISLTMQLFDLNETWIPTIGRLLTLGVVGMGFWVNYRLFSKIHTNSLPSIIGLCLSGCLWFSPLIGFWAMTVRPDVIGLLFDLCAVYFVLKYPSNTLKGIILASFFCYLSWACKQVNIVTPTAIGLFLLVQKRWRSFIVFSILMGAGFACTLLFASYDLLKTLFFIKTSVSLSKEVFVGNLINFIKKSLASLTLFGIVYLGVLLNPAVRKKILSDEMVKLGFCGLVAWAMILLPFSSKIGSADNYHFIALLFFLLTIGGALKQLEFENKLMIKSSFAIAGLMITFSVIFSLSQGTLQSIKQQHKTNMALKQCLEKLPVPIFVTNHYGALPWMNPSSISFVLAYNYWRDRYDNRPFEHNGIGGLIQQGYFNSLLLPKEFPLSFDGATLTSYHLHPQECIGYAVFTKKENA